MPSANDSGRAIASSEAPTTLTRAVELTRALDGLALGLFVCTPAGGMLHETRALVGLLEGDPERERLRGEVLRVAYLIGALLCAQAKTNPPGIGGDPIHREIRTAVACYRVHGSALRPGLLDPEGAVLVALERLSPEPVSDCVLREVFGLSVREVQIARLATAGYLNPEIARRLGVSRHTVRHHIEHVLTKLGVHRRGEIAARLRGE